MHITRVTFDLLHTSTAKLTFFLFLMMKKTCHFFSQLSEYPKTAYEVIRSTAQQSIKWRGGEGKK